MISVQKYELEWDGPVATISMPRGAKVLDVKPNGATTFIWVMVDSDKEEKPYRFVRMLTGEEIHKDTAFVIDHIGTYQLNKSERCTHVFREMDTAEALMREFRGLI